MGRASRIDKLPRAIREEIGRLRSEQHCTIDQILAHLRQLGVDDVSRSGLARHTQEIDALAEQLRLSRGMASAVAERLEDSDDDQVARLNIELMQNLLFKLLAAAGGDQSQLAPKDLQQLATTMQRLAGAGKSQVELATLVRKLRKEGAILVDADRELAAVGGAPAERARAALSKVRELLGVPDVAA